MEETSHSPSRRTRVLLFQDPKGPDGSITEAYLHRLRPKGADSIITYVPWWMACDIQSSLVRWARSSSRQHLVCMSLVWSGIECVTCSFLRKALTARHWGQGAVTVISMLWCWLSERKNDWPVRVCIAADNCGAKKVNFVAHLLYHYTRNGSTPHWKCRNWKVLVPKYHKLKNISSKRHIKMASDMVM